MSLEQQISELKDAIVSLTAVLAAKSVPTVTTSAPAPAPIPHPIPAPVVAAPAMPPAPIAPPPPAPVMPPPPSFLATPAPAPAVTLPFSDPKGLIEYVMETYKKLGREKGAAIGEVLTKMGLKAINEVQPSQYAEFYAAVEAIK